MNWLEWHLKIGIGFVAIVVAFFWLLQFISNRTYKPTKEDIKSLIQDTLEGKINLGRFDEFTCVKIAYNSQLDMIRKKFNDIVDNPAYIIGGGSSENVVPLNESGKSQLRKLLEELDAISIK